MVLKGSVPIFLTISESIQGGFWTGVIKVLQRSEGVL